MLTYVEFKSGAFPAYEGEAENFSLLHFDLNVFIYAVVLSFRGL